MNEYVWGAKSVIYVHDNTMVVDSWAHCLDDLMITSWIQTSLVVIISLCVRCDKRVCVSICVTYLQIVALLCAGLHPNVCVHKEKRHVITSDKKIALIHKSSVNLIYKHPSFTSPYLVFEEKVITHTDRDMVPMCIVKSVFMWFPLDQVQGTVSSINHHGGAPTHNAVWILFYSFMSNQPR